MNPQPSSNKHFNTPEKKSKYSYNSGDLQELGPFLLGDRRQSMNESGRATSHTIARKLRAWSTKQVFFFWFQVYKASHLLQWSLFFSLKTVQILEQRSQSLPTILTGRQKAEIYFGQLPSGYYRLTSSPYMCIIFMINNQLTLGSQTRDPRRLKSLCLSPTAWAPFLEGQRGSIDTPIPKQSGQASYSLFKKKGPMGKAISF